MALRRTKRHDAGPSDTAILSRSPLEFPAVQPAAPDEEEPRPHLSFVRVLLAVLLIVGAIYGGSVAIKTKLTATAASRQTTFFAPYVDVTLTPTYQFQLPVNDPARQSVLGFVTASSPSTCAPSWGGAYSLGEANQALALGARIAQVQGNGGSVVVSFGGQKHTSRAVACQSPATLARAYESVIKAYDLHTIDLDVEGPALDSFAAEQRRAAAVRILEQDAAKAHRRLNVWLTLPVEPNGLQGNALSVVSSMLRDRARFAGVDVMAMDFTHPPASGSTMLDLVERSLTSTHDQLSRLLPRYGIHLGGQKIWQLLGVTVMIGQNNLAGERFTVADAEGLRAFARQHGLGRLSMWSINRDQQCGAGYGALVLSNTCSGTPQSGLEFSDVFDHLTGAIKAGTAHGANLLRPVKPDTNPADAPFPLWNPTASYVAGYKVVENGEIYQAKWYNSAQDPAAQFQYTWQSPWELLGPVIPGDHAPVIQRPRPGTYPTWSTSRRYIAGERVISNGLPYEAKWTNQGVAPTVAAGIQPSSPWQPMYQIPGEPTSTATGAAAPPVSGTS